MLAPADMQSTLTRARRFVSGRPTWAHPHAHAAHATHACFASVLFEPNVLSGTLTCFLVDDLWQIDARSSAE